MLFQTWWAFQLAQLKYNNFLMSQRRNCFSCKGQGHVAKYCPYKNQGDNPIPDICLRCGDTGHDMFSCCIDYCPRDIQVCWIVYQFFFLKYSFLFQPPICIFLCSVVDELNENATIMLFWTGNTVLQLQVFWSSLLRRFSVCISNIWLVLHLWPVWTLGFGKSFFLLGLLSVI